MSVDDLRLVRSSMDAFIRGDLEQALRAASPDVITRRAPPLPDPQTNHGHRGVLQTYTDWTAEFGEFEMDYEDCVDLGDGRIMLAVVQRATGRTSGVEVFGRFWILYRVEAGLIVRLDIFASSEQALEESAMRPSIGGS